MILPSIDDDDPALTDGQYWDIAAITADLAVARADWRAAHRRHAEHGAAGFPSRAVLEKIVAALCGALFPLRLGPSFVRAHNEAAFVAESLQTALGRLYGQIRRELFYSMLDAEPDEVERVAGRIIGGFAADLPRLRRILDEDVEAAFRGDPAARSVDEVLLCYPSVVAIIHHRLANTLYQLGAPIVAPGWMSMPVAECAISARMRATIGRSFFIDHGSGVVIGETAIIGDRVRLYQAVTLGARSFPSDGVGSLTKGLLRHPIVEDDVVIYAGATILGRVTIGRGAVIGGNVWLTESVPADSIIHAASASAERPNADQLPSGTVNLAAAAI